MCLSHPGGYVHLTLICCIPRFSFQALGYKGEMGYQTFLYSNEADIRRVLMFLVEKLPKDTAVTSDEPLGKASVSKRPVASGALPMPPPTQTFLPF